MRETVWKFETARFRVELQIEPEDMDPEDSFEFQEDIDAVRNGDVEWFQAIVAVYCDGRKVAWDALGGCAYATVREFYTAHWDSEAKGRNCSIQTPEGRRYSVCHYFPDMISQAIAEARKVLHDVPSLRT